MAEVLKRIVEKLDSWQLMIIILTTLMLIGSVVFFILINRIHIKLFSVLEINAKSRKDDVIT
jgi:hypothetical protein